MQKRQRIPFDKLWKSATEELFDDFLFFFLPELAAEVDFSEQFVFLEQELQAVITGKNNTSSDKLAKIKLKNGEERWLFIHIEFENSRKTDIKQRMYDYHSRIKEKYGQEITAIVIFNGRNVPKNGNRYEKTVFGTKISYEYNTYVVIEQDEADLIANPNPFAVAVLANLYVLKTYNDAETRLELKKQIYHIVRVRGYSDDKIRRLLFFIAELVQLPSFLEEKFEQYISKPQKSNAKMYTTHRSRDLIDTLAQAEYGTSVSDLKEALKSKDNALKSKDNALKSKDNALANTIAQLFVKMQMTAEAIAELMGIDQETVVATLKKAKLIKK